MAVVFRSDRLTDKPYNRVHDEAMVLSFWRDPIAYAQIANDLPAPQTRKDINALMDRFMTQQLIAVIICAPEPQPSPYIVPIGWVKLKDFGERVKHHRRSEIADKAIRLYERLGFVREGEDRDYVLHEGKWWSSVNLSMLEHEWKAMENEVKGQPTASSHE